MSYKTALKLVGTSTLFHANSFISLKVLRPIFFNFLEKIFLSNDLLFFPLSYAENCSAIPRASAYALLPVHFPEFWHRALSSPIPTRTSELEIRYLYPFNLQHSPIAPHLEILHLLLSVSPIVQVSDNMCFILICHLILLCGQRKLLST